jgi:HAD domain in Swiss Army Knife RNA repair proteins
VVIFLDIDGVLNDHTPQENRYCGMNRECVSRFNRILDAVPEANIVISSAWRYMILRGDLTIKGFEMLMLTHGVKCHDRVIGCTTADGPIEDEPHHHDEPDRWKNAGLKWRGMQIKHYAFEYDIRHYVAIDDLPIDIPELHLVDGDVGLDDQDVEEIIAKLKASNP